MPKYLILREYTIKNHLKLVFIKIKIRKKNPLHIKQSLLDVSFSLVLKVCIQSWRGKGHGQKMMAENWNT